MNRLEKQILGAILALGLVLRLIAVLALPPEEDYPDTEQFVGIARSVVAGHGFELNGKAGHGRSPMYPMMLAACFAVSDGTLLPKLVQVALDLASVGLVVLLSLRLGSSNRAALAAGGLWAVNPYAAQFVRLLLSECLAGTLFLAALVVWTGLFDRPRLRDALAAGVLFGACALTRASTLGVMAIAAAMLVWRGVAPRGERLRAAFAVCVAMGLTLAPWTVRNTLLYGEVVLVAPIGGMTLYDSLNPYADGGVRTRPHDVWPSGRTMAEVDRNHRAAAMAWASANPWRVLELAVEKQKRFWSPVPNAERYRRMPFLLVGVFEAPMLVLGLLGAVLAVVRRRAAGRLVPILVYFPLLHTIYLGSLRYRMPIEPLLGLFCALTLDELLRPSTPD